MGAPSNVITLTIKCDLDLDEIFGRVHVYTTQDKTMDWVLDEFCREKNVKRVSTFALRSATGQDYDLTKTISECNLGEGDLIYCYNKSEFEKGSDAVKRECFNHVLNAMIAINIAFAVPSKNATQ